MPENLTTKKTVSHQTVPVSMTDRMRKAITKIKPGVVLVAAHDSSVMPYVRMVTERVILEGKQLADLPMSYVNALHALYGANSRDADFAKTLHRCGPSARQISERYSCVPLAHCRDFSSLTDEGVHLLLEHLGDGACVTAQVTVTSVAREEMAGMLSKLDSAAKERNGLIVLFLHLPKSEDAAWMRRHAQEVILADKCDPGPGALVAFSLTATSLEYLHTWGVGRTMCEVWAEDGWDFKQTIFVAATALDRAIWYLHCENETVTTIASLVGKDKSNVSRRLKALPLSKDLDAEIGPYDGWREDWFPFLGLDLEPESDEEANDNGEAPPPDEDKGQSRSRKPVEI